MMLAPEQGEVKAGRVRSFTRLRGPYQVEPETNTGNTQHGWRGLNVLPADSGDVSRH